MHILESGGSLAHLQFLPDGRLLACVSFENDAAGIDVWSWPQGDRVRLSLPAGGKWGDINCVAVHPSGETCYVAWNGCLLSFRVSDGAMLPMPGDLAADQVVISPKGDRLVIARADRSSRDIRAIETNADGNRVVWRDKAESMDYTESMQCRVAGFLPDGDRFITVSEAAVCIRAFQDNRELATTRFPANTVSYPVLSPDGRYLGVSGYTSMYVYETNKLGKPRRISGSNAWGNFISFAFHPSGRTLAVIHGGPTLVKVYDLDTLRLDHKLNWKLSPLQCVAFSPDGLLGAAGSQDGRILLWDIDP